MLELDFCLISCYRKLALIMMLTNTIDEASLVTFNRNSWNFENTV